MAVVSLYPSPSSQPAPNPALVSQSKRKEKYEALIACGVAEGRARVISEFPLPGKLPKSEKPLSLWTYDELLQLTQRSGLLNAKSLSRDELIETLNQMRKE